VRIEWDARKAAANFKKHRVSFLEAASTLFDPLALTGDDPDHSLDEQRSLTFGVSSANRLLVVAHADGSDVIRIISARSATKSERVLYEEG